METYWVFHLAASWGGQSDPSPALNSPLAITNANKLPASTSSHLDTVRTSLDRSQPVHNSKRPSIRAAAVQMVFASRSSQDFIIPEHVSKLEAWCGQAVLEALRAIDIPQDVRVRQSECTAHITN